MTAEPPILKPCPFCGLTHAFIHETHPGIRWMVYCPRCGASFKERTSPEEAAERWNARAYATSEWDELIEQLERRRMPEVDFWEKGYNEALVYSIAIMRQFQSYQAEVAEARSLLQEGDFLGYEESEQIITKLLEKDKPNKQYIYSLNDAISNKDDQQPDGLSSCPFCGGRAFFVPCNERDADYVECSESTCHASLFRRREHGERQTENLRQRWNRRIPKRESHWHPIKNAPKDRPIFAHALEHGGNTMLVEWNGRVDYWTDPQGHAFEWDYWAEANIPPLPENVMRSSDD